MIQFPKIDWGKVERFIGGLKFAVLVITLFTIAMIAGTFIESNYGTDFANRMIYKTPAFMLIQFGILLSIIFAAALRLPAKKRLYGFYTIHLGLLIIGMGAAITYMAGVDGHITLEPNTPNRQVVLSEDILKITYPNDGKQVTKILPFSAFKTSLNEEYDNIKIKDYIPFAEGKFVWRDSTNNYSPEAQIHSSKYHFKNAFAAQDIFLTIHPEAGPEFLSSVSDGPLSFNYFPASIAHCFGLNNPSKIFIYNIMTAECFTPEEKNLAIKMTSAKNRFVVVPYNNALLTFFPDSSPMPMNANLQPDESSVLRTISLKMYETSPTLFLFGKKAAYYSKADKKWSVVDLELNGPPITLPWMGSEISLKDHQERAVPFNIPSEIIPIQQNGSLIRGDLRAISLEISGKEYWVTNYSPLSLSIMGKSVVFEITKDSINLPFELALTQFKMDKDPGTNNPASYESFVKLFSDGKSTNHHVFMNNPIKHSGYTLYQASYAEGNDGQYSSTLAVNVDQGRAMKYLGSLMLVLGAVWHYNLTSKDKKKGKDKDQDKNQNS